MLILDEQLAKQGIIDIETKGKSKFTLPRFGSFVLFQKNYWKIKSSRLERPYTMELYIFHCYIRYCHQSVSKLNPLHICSYY